MNPREIFFIVLALGGVSALVACRASGYFSETQAASLLASQEGDGNPWRGIVLQTEQHRMAFVPYPAIIPRDIPPLDTV